METEGTATEKGPRETMGHGGTTWRAIGGAVALPENVVSTLVARFISNHPIDGKGASETVPYGSISIEISKEAGWERPTVRIATAGQQGGIP